MAKPSSILTPGQRQVLDLIADEPYFCKHYYFTGGTPLAEFYLPIDHREWKAFFVKEARKLKKDIFK